MQILRIYAEFRFKDVWNHANLCRIPHPIPETFVKLCICLCKLTPKENQLKDLQNPCSTHADLNVNAKNTVGIQKPRIFGF